MFHRTIASSLLIVGFSPSLWTFSFAQKTATEVANDTTKPQIVTFTTQQDHQNMMNQLGITKLRPGPSGNPDAPNAANTDESKANPYPKLPELMTLKDGTMVSDGGAVVEAASARDRRRL